MVVSCWVKGCSNRADGSVKRSFYYIPKVRVHEGEQTRKLSEERRRSWLANINRKDAPSSTSRICSEHFINGIKMTFTHCHRYMHNDLFTVCFKKNLC